MWYSTETVHSVFVTFQQFPTSHEILFTTSRLWMRTMLFSHPETNFTQFGYGFTLVVRYTFLFPWKGRKTGSGAIYTHFLREWMREDGMNGVLFCLNFLLAILTSSFPVLRGQVYTKYPLDSSLYYLCHSLYTCRHYVHLRSPLYQFLFKPPKLNPKEPC